MFTCWAERIDGDNFETGRSKRHNHRNNILDKNMLRERRRHANFKPNRKWVKRNFLLDLSQCFWCFPQLLFFPQARNYEKLKCSYFHFPLFSFCIGIPHYSLRASTRTRHNGKVNRLFGIQKRSNWSRCVVICSIENENFIEWHKTTATTSRNQCAASKCRNKQINIDCLYAFNDRFKAICFRLFGAHKLNEWNQ